MTIDTPLSQQCSSGVLADTKGRIKGLWLSFLGEQNHQQHKDIEYHLGVNVQILSPVLEALSKSLSLATLNMKGFPAEFAPIHLAQAKNMVFNQFIIYI
jgi:hypothetical protein